MSRKELISLLKKIMVPPLNTTEDERDEWMLTFERNVPHPDGYCVKLDEEYAINIQDIETFSPLFNKYVEAVVDKALSYKPIILPERFLNEENK